MWRLTTVATICAGFLLYAAEGHVEQRDLAYQQAGGAEGAAAPDQGEAKVLLAQASPDRVTGELKQPETIWLSDPRAVLHAPDSGFPTRYHGPVRFNHREHVIGARLGCNSCHHDYRAHRMKQGPVCETCHRKDTGAWTEPRLKCVTCHQTPIILAEQAPKPVVHEDGGIDPKLHRLASAFHHTCIGCHRETNAKLGLVRYPVSCRSCHMAVETEYRFEER